METLTGHHWGGVTLILHIFVDFDVAQFYLRDLVEIHVSLP